MCVAIVKVVRIKGPQASVNIGFMLGVMAKQRTPLNSECFRITKSVFSFTLHEKKTLVGITMPG